MYDTEIFEHYNCNLKINNVFQGLEQSLKHLEGLG